MRPDAGAIWLTWEPHRRTRELAAALQLELVELHAGRGGWRYPRLLAQTAHTVLRHRPALVFVQCPSIVLGLAAVMLKQVFGFILVADLHNEAVSPFNYSSRIYQRIVRLIWSGADICIVTNHALKRLVERSGATTCVLPDRVPALSPAGPSAGRERIVKVVFICTFAPDEPVREVIQAAGILGPGFQLAVTGDPRRLPLDIVLPPNVELTGFLPDAGYEQTLRDADVLLDLTRMDDCLVCGGYEAVAVEKPLVTSDTAALRTLFSRGTVFATHDPLALAAAIVRASEERERLAGEMRTLKQELAVSWAHQCAALVRRIGAISGALQLEPQ
jgi:glycosyltransferase involved in cell wall biosynthesis